jgi:hypothetical protein
MPGDRKEFREHAKRCWALASECEDPVFRRSLVQTAQRWVRLAAELETTNSLLDPWGPENAKKAG